MKKLSVKQLSKISMFGSISFILMLINTSIPIFPQFLKLDLSDVPVLVILITGGLYEAIFVSLLKNILHLTVTQTSGIGELINFVMSVSFVLMVYSFNKSTGKIKVSLFISSIIISIFSAFLNYFIMLPLYSFILGINKQMILDLAAAFNPAVTNIYVYFLYIIIPFNLLKFAIVSILSYNLIKKLKGGIYYDKSINL